MRSRGRRTAPTTRCSRRRSTSPTRWRRARGATSRGRAATPRRCGSRRWTRLRSFRPSTPRDSTPQFAPHASARAALSLPQTVPTCRVPPPLAAPPGSLSLPVHLSGTTARRGMCSSRLAPASAAFARRAKIEGSESPAGREKTTLRRARLAIGKAGARPHRLNRWKDRAAERTAAEAVAVYSTASGSGDLEERTTTGTSATGERASGAKRAAVYIAHHRAAAGSDARFLHAQLERALGEPCFLGGRGDGAAYAQACDESLASARALVLVQTAEVLTVPRVLSTATKRCAARSRWCPCGSRAATTTSTWRATSSSTSRRSCRSARRPRRSPSSRRAPPPSASTFTRFRWR